MVPSTAINLLDFVKGPRLGLDEYFASLQVRNTHWALPRGCCCFTVVGSVCAFGAGRAACVLFVSALRAGACSDLGCLKLPCCCSLTMMMSTTPPTHPIYEQSTTNQRINRHQPAQAVLNSRALASTRSSSPPMSAKLGSSGASSPRSPLDDDDDDDDGARSRGLHPFTHESSADLASATEAQLPLLVQLCVV